MWKSASDVEKNESRQKKPHTLPLSFSEKGTKNGLNMEKQEHQ
jgi:hypothetical protein